MKASRPSGSFFVVLVVLVAADADVAVVGSIVTLTASVLAGVREIAQSGQHVHLACVLAPDLKVVGAARSIAQAFERSTLPMRVANRSGRAVDDGGRYRRLAVSRAHFE